MKKTTYILIGLLSAIIIGIFITGLVATNSKFSQNYVHQVSSMGMSSSPTCIELDPATNVIIADSSNYSFSDIKFLEMSYEGKDYMFEPDYDRTFSFITIVEDPDAKAPSITLVKEWSDILDIEVKDGTIFMNFHNKEGDIGYREIFSTQIVVNMPKVESVSSNMDNCLTVRSVKGHQLSITSANKVKLYSIDLDNLTVCGMSEDRYADYDDYYPTRSNGLCEYSFYTTLSLYIYDSSVQNLTLNDSYDIKLFNESNVKNVVVDIPSDMSTENVEFHFEGNTPEAITLHPAYEGQSLTLKVPSSLNLKIE